MSELLTDKEMRRYQRVVKRLGAKRYFNPVDGFVFVKKWPNVFSDTTDHVVEHVVEISKFSPSVSYCRTFAPDVINILNYRLYPCPCGRVLWDMTSLRLCVELSDQETYLLQHPRELLSDWFSRYQDETMLRQLRQLSDAR